MSTGITAIQATMLTGVRGTLDLAKASPVGVKGSPLSASTGIEQPWVVQPLPTFIGFREQQAMGGKVSSVWHLSCNTVGTKDAAAAF